MDLKDSGWAVKSGRCGAKEDSHCDLLCAAELGAPRTRWNAKPWPKQDLAPTRSFTTGGAREVALPSSPAEPRGGGRDG